MSLDPTGVTPNSFTQRQRPGETPRRHTENTNVVPLAVGGELFHGTRTETPWGGQGQARSPVAEALQAAYELWEFGKGGGVVEKEVEFLVIANRCEPELGGDGLFFGADGARGVGLEGEDGAVRI